MAIEVRHLRPDDDDQVRDVLTAAFADGGHVAELAAALRARPDVQASLVAVEDGDRVVGYVHLSVSWVDAPSRLIEVLTLSPLGVDPARHRQRIGTALVAEATETAAELGAPVVFLEGDPAYYGRLGWRPAAGLGFRRPSVRIPEVAFQAYPLATYDPATMSGALVYNDTFWSHDCVGLRG